jgi:hypothetical protein
MSRLSSRRGEIVDIDALADEFRLLDLGGDADVDAISPGYEGHMQRVADRVNSFKRKFVAWFRKSGWRLRQNIGFFQHDITPQTRLVVIARIAFFPRQSQFVDCHVEVVGTDNRLLNWDLRTTTFNDFPDWLGGCIHPDDARRLRREARAVEYSNGGELCTTELFSTTVENFVSWSRQTPAVFFDHAFGVLARAIDVYVQMASDEQTSILVDDIAKPGIPKGPRGIIKQFAQPRFEGIGNELFWGRYEKRNFRGILQQRLYSYSQGLGGARFRPLYERFSEFTREFDRIKQILSDRLVELRSSEAIRENDALTMIGDQCIGAYERAYKKIADAIDEYVIRTTQDWPSFPTDSTKMRIEKLLAAGDSMMELLPKLLLAVSRFEEMWDTSPELRKMMQTKWLIENVRYYARYEDDDRISFRRSVNELIIHTADQEMMSPEKRQEWLDQNTPTMIKHFSKVRAHALQLNKDIIDVEKDLARLMLKNSIF